MTVLKHGEFGPPRIAGRVLVILCAYRGGAGRQPPWLPLAGRRGSRWLGWITLYRLRVHVAQLRDHYANPRTVEYQADLARSALALGGVDSVKMIVDASLAEGATALPRIGADAPEVMDLSTQEPPLSVIDSVLLVYPDPLGLGGGRLERKLRARKSLAIAVVNGRRRVFPLTRQAAHALRWRRLLAKTRLVEVAAAPAVLLVAAVLAVTDAVRGTR